MSVAGEDSSWRVGFHRSPADYTPHELCSWNHRFDDLERRFRSIYAAEAPETALREVLADLRPNTSAIRRYVQLFGTDAAADVPRRSVTASWRQQNVLAPVRPRLGGNRLIDLCDVAVCSEVEHEYADLLAEHGRDHLDLPQITARDRPFTQALAARLHDDHDDVAGVRFPSQRDGRPCIALFEGRGALEISGESLPLTDPPIGPLRAVCASWKLELQPAESV